MSARNLFVGILFALCLLSSCSPPPENPAKPNDRLQVTATIYPIYDFARVVGGEKVSVSMLMPPGADAHHYEPPPSDIIKVIKSDIFLFTGFGMEQWAQRILKAAEGNSNMLAVETGRGARLIETSIDADRHDDHPHAHDKSNSKSTKYDPHIWLDFDNARIMVDHIAQAFILKDPKNRSYYQANAETYKRRLADLDKKYRTELSRCPSRTILHAGHWAFAYLAQRYRLEYVSAYNVSADSEPSPSQIMSLIERIRSQRLSYIFYEEMASPRLAQTLAAETGAKLLKLQNGHDIGKEEIQSGVSFLTMMENNLNRLKQGMQCR